MSPIPARLFAGVSAAETIDDVLDSELVYCPTCDEEYNLPEGTTICPICGGRLQALDGE